MKKFLALLMMCILVLSLGVDAFAYKAPVSSPVASSVETGKTSALPKIVSELSDQTLKITEYANRDKELVQEKFEEFEAGKKALKDGAPDGMSAMYYFYEEASSYPCNLVVEIDNVNEVVAKLYRNGEWSGQAVTSDNGIYTINLTDAGPLAIYTK